MNKMLFDYLIVGLDKLQRQNGTYYPYPPELILAMNELANLLGSNYPKTFDALLSLLEAPVGEWLPDTDLPDPLIPEAQILYRKQLDDIAIQYLEDHQLEEVGGFTDIQSTRENQIMVDLIRQARQEYAGADTLDNMMRIEEDYAEARYFLVQHPITSWQKLKQSFRNNRYREQILAM